jgi:hypothetical protein
MGRAEIAWSGPCHCGVRPAVGLKTAGVPTRDIQEALRHRDQRTTATYLHTSDGEKTGAMNLLPSRR